MIIVMQHGAGDAQVGQIIEELSKRGFTVHRSTGQSTTVLGVIGKTESIDSREVELLGGVDKVIRVSKPYKLAAREFHPSGTVLHVGNTALGGDEVAVIAGPCSIENEEMIHATAKALKALGAVGLRGGAFKPRTSPYAFTGLAEQGLCFLRDAAREHDMFSVTEVMEISQIELVASYCDILQVGMRNMQNYNLLRALGQIRKPVLLKRGNSATYEEWLMAAEYLLAGGNEQVILCERGIRTFETYTRNTMDIAAIPVIQSLSHLPIFADPSHGTGLRSKVPAMSRAAIAAGAHGLLVEVHPDPDHAISDGPQSLTFDQFSRMMVELRIIASATGRRLAGAE
ncbi:3-deoxy-7-phosphoheptulonate synthase [candidate division KSB1 bacterium]|nr:3-deoxy-7-phosphoheptulonate synthase [candidate division KSB1 bacterium]